MPESKQATLFRNGRSQAVRIPREMEMPGKSVLIHREGVRLVLEPVGTPLPLLDLIATWTPLSTEFPNVDDGLPPLDDIQL